MSIKSADGSDFLDWTETAEDFLGRPLAPNEIESFKVYEALLLEWNARFNLTAITDPAEIRLKHFLDSLSGAGILRSLNRRKIADIGTGAGFPGIPLKIVCPELQLTLVDSVAKKLNFCGEVISRLGLKNCGLVHARAEEIALRPQYRESFDAVTARAVARLPILSEFLLPLLKPGGIMVAYKGESAETEAKDAESAVKVLGGGDITAREVFLPGVEGRRFLVSSRKIRPTPSDYPRSVAVIRKNPLG